MMHSLILTGVICITNVEMNSLWRILYEGKNYMRWLLERAMRMKMLL